MPVKLKREDLQQDKYKYTWERDKGDGVYIGPRDRLKVDKDEGYEVLHFIESIMNEFGLTELDDVHAIEDILHLKEYSKMIMREELKRKVKLLLGLS